MGEPGELLAVAEEKFNLEAGFVIPVERDGSKSRSVLKGGRSVGPPVNDDTTRTCRPGGEIDEAFEAESRVGEATRQIRRVAWSNRPYRRSGGAHARRRSGIEVTRIGIAPECADQVEL